MQPILTVDLRTGVFDQITVPTAWRDDYLGGASLAARLLYKQITPELDPLSPEAPLLLINGPLSGTAGPSVGRYVICAKSPATGLWGESNCGGFWGPELRMAGFDGLLITGRAPQPVYLWIHNDQVELRSARHLWGLDTYQTQEAIQVELTQSTARVACIGPAGELRIPYAVVLCDHGRVAGRTGMGAVMGSKNLKAIAVKGNRQVPVADPGVFNSLRTRANRELRLDPLSKVVRDLGTASVSDYFDYLREMPKYYFQYGTYPEELRISGMVIAETILACVSACHACVIACGRVVNLEDGNKRKGPEYETLVGFGPNLGLNDPVVATRLGELCDRFGMDTISMSNTIGLALKLFEKGVIGIHETGGMVLNWGDAGVVEQLIRQTVQREGLGAHLAEGARAFGKKFEVEEEAVQVNGLEVAYHDPRGASGMALVYATSPRGACHNQSDYFLVEIGQAEGTLGMEYYPPKAGAEKAANVARHQDWRTLFNSLVMCLFANVDPETVLALVNASSGLSLDLDAMMNIGERGWNLKRVINHRLGLTRQNDRLPKALLRPYNDDPDGKQGFAPDLEPMLRAYYLARGWDPVTGFPGQDKLEELGLGWTLPDLQSLL